MHRKLLIPLSLLLAACAEDAGPSVRVGEVAIPEAQFAALGAPEQGMLLDLAAFGSIVAEERLNVLIDPLAERAADDARAAALAYHLGAESMGLDDAGLRAAYERFPDWELDVRHVVRLVEPTASQSARSAARGVAAEVARRAAAGEDFAALAASFSEEPGAAERGGLLQPGRRGSWVEPFWNAAVALQPGETSGVVESEYGYHVLRLDARRPVPFEEADRGELLRRVVPGTVAADAIADWAAGRGSILIDPPALRTAMDSVVAGRPPPDSLVIATGAGGSYTAEDLVVGWADLEVAERQSLEQGDELGFARWVEADARDVLWAAAARDVGVDAPSSDADLARATWGATFAFWAELFGFRRGMDGSGIYEAARQATLSGEPEVRARRQELRSFRPWLRELYPAAVPET